MGLMVVPMIVHGPTDEWLNPRVWEFWAMLFSVAAMVAVGYLAALKEDQERRIRQQRRRQAMPRRRSPQQTPRQQAVSYSLKTWHQPNRAKPAPRQRPNRAEPPQRSTPPHATRRDPPSRRRQAIQPVTEAHPPRSD